MPYTTTFSSLSSRGWKSDQVIFYTYNEVDFNSTGTDPGRTGGVKIARDTGNILVYSDAFANVSLNQRAGIFRKATSTNNIIGNIANIATGNTANQYLSTVIGVDDYGNYAVASDGAQIITIGTPYTYVYANSANVWTEQANIVGQHPTINGNGDTLAVWTSVYNITIYERSVNTWSNVANFTSNADINFGRADTRKSFNQNGNILVVGSPSDDSGATDAGKIFIYEKVANVWTETANITGNVANYQIGKSVQLNSNGNMMIVGVPGYGTSGAIFTYENIANTWTHTNTITSNVAYSLSKLGDSGISANDNISTVLGHSSDGTDSYVHIFQYDTTNDQYIETQSINSTDPNITGGFGFGQFLDMTYDGSKFVTSTVTNTGTKGIYLFSR